MIRAGPHISVGFMIQSSTKQSGDEQTSAASYDLRTQFDTIDVDVCLKNQHAHSADELTICIDPPSAGEGSSAILHDSWPSTALQKMQSSRCVTTSRFKKSTCKGASRYDEGK